MPDAAQLEGEVQAHLEFCNIPADIAARRAPITAQALIASGFELRFHRNLVSDHRVPIVEYDIPDDRSSIDKARKADQILNYLGGTWLDRGDLLFLSIVADAASSVFGTDWINRFRSELRNPTQHLDVLNELWWLSHFRRPTGIEADHALSPPTDVDWRFTAGGLAINLEVKRRRKDLLRAIYGVENRDIFSDILPKFVPVDDAINVAAITLYGGVDRFIQEITANWLTSDDNEGRLDAVLLWSPFQRFGTSFDLQIGSERGKQLKSVVLPPTIEEESMVLFTTHPLDLDELLLRFELENLTAALQPGENKSSQINALPASS